MAEPTNTPPADNPTGDPQPTFLDSIREHIPDDFKEKGYWNNIPDMGTLLKNYGNSQDMISRSIRIPGDDATPEQMADFYKKLGRPDDLKGYQLEGVEGADKLPTDLVDWFKQVAFDHGLSQKAFSGILSKYSNVLAESEEQKDAKIHEGAVQLEEQLKRADEWGANYNRNMAWAKRAVERVAGGDEEVINIINESGLGNHPKFAKFMYRIGRNMAEHGMITASVEGSVGRDEALVKRGELMARPEYLDRTKPGHKELVDEVQRLTQVAYGE